ncbi:hypothetical protein LPJ61_002428 [Coemansia biformis]|uniref:Uncharacterized protein n=1 Tax=Coemansia biformis TaxID=1286918 RepID=A0A9W7YET6_9FUNG|nr:hypothetical protein LPJ61_002428 [Coemansia biformis]
MSQSSQRPGASATRATTASSRIQSPPTSTKGDSVLLDDASDSEAGTPTSGLDGVDGAALAVACPLPTLKCVEGEMRVLLGTEGGCGWECQPDPFYKAPSNNKGPIIGGSLGAMLFVLGILLVLLLAVHGKKVRRERATYAKDTEDLVRELSSEPLLRSTQSVYRRLSVGAASVATQEGLASRLAPFFGLRSGAEQSARLDPYFVAMAPVPNDAGTELTMDIVDRPPENDPSLAIAEGAVPYRQEKTAAAYPLLAVFSLPPDLDEPTEVHHGHGDIAPQQTPTAHPLERADTLEDLVSPFSSHQTTPDYEAAKRSGHAAIAAARVTAMGSPALASFDPFCAIPSIPSSPFSASPRNPSSYHSSSGPPSGSAH